MILLQVEKNLSLEEYISILNSSGLGKRRPMHDPDHLKRMIQGSNLLVTAREEGELVGFLRGLSDYCYRCFIADLAIAKDFQRKGVGSEILKFTRSLAPGARMFLFAAEDAESFYQKLGFKAHEHCYQLKPEDPIL